MNVISTPAPYGSAFRAACFVLDNVGAPGGVDIEIASAGGYETLGIKRLYASGTAAVNVAPYARRLLDPVPLVGKGHGFHDGTGRTAACFISAPGFSSAAAVLCAGTERAPVNALLSASPVAVNIRPGERDEMSVVSGDWVTPAITFRRGGVVYTDSSIGARIASGMLSAVVDADAVCASYARTTGGAADELGEFTVRLKIGEEGYSGRAVERTYTIDRISRGGVRLAWLNRYGAVDYHTFAVADELRSGGSRAEIETPTGRRTAATVAARSVRLLSEPLGMAAAEWLAEIYSSPAVWRIEGGEYSRVAVAAGEAVCSPLEPAVVRVVVSGTDANVSRKL